MNNDKNVVVFENVSFSYGSDPVLESINLWFEMLDFVSFVGPNGGGKTTLLKLILGLLKPETGTIKVFNKLPQQARIMIGYMPQHMNFDPFFPITAGEVVLSGRIRTRAGFFRFNKHDREVASSMLEVVGLKGLGKKSFFSLSGGQRQRILIARALTIEPRLLLLDEPTANLDPGAQEDFFELLQKLNKNLTILMVSHDLTFVSSYAKTVICINRKASVHPTSHVPSCISFETTREHLRMVLHDQTIEES